VFSLEYLVGLCDLWIKHLAGQSHEGKEERNGDKNVRMGKTKALLQGK